MPHQHLVTQPHFCFSFLFTHLDGYAGAVGTFSMDVNVTLPPAPTPSPTPFPTPLVLSQEDGCTAATTIAIGSTTSGSTSGNSVYQTEQCGPAYELLTAGTWYKASSANAGTLFASLCENTFYDTMVSGI